MIYPTRKPVLLYGRFLVMKIVILIHLATLFHGVHSVTYLETSPLELISATQSSTDNHFTADLAIDEDFDTYSHTSASSDDITAWLRVQFKEGIVGKAVVYNRLGHTVIPRWAIACTMTLIPPIIWKRLHDVAIDYVIGFNQFKDFAYNNY